MPFYCMVSRPSLEHSSPKRELLLLTFSQSSYAHMFLNTDSLKSFDSTGKIGFLLFPTCCLDAFGYVWIPSDMFGYVRVCPVLPDAFRRFWKTLGFFEQFTKFWGGLKIVPRPPQQLTALRPRPPEAIYNTKVK